MQTDRTRKKIRACVSLTAVLAVALCMTALPAMADLTDDSSEGSFTLDNAAPDVTVVELYDDLETSTTTSMTPQTEYALKIVASDTNTLNDIEYVTVVIMMQTYGGPGDDVFDQATYKYTKGSGWSMVGPLSTTWSIDGTDSKVPGDLTGMSGTWWLHFTPGKVAREATWDITVTAQDYTAGTDPLSQTGLSMQWYGELTADDTSFGFGSVELGQSDLPISTPSDNKVDVKAIANGDYKLESKSGNWIGQGAGAETATLDWDGTLESGKFMLEDRGTNAVSGAHIVKDFYTTIEDCAVVSAPTAETGDSKGVYAWVSLAADGFIPQEYKGNFYVQILTD